MRLHRRHPGSTIAALAVLFVVAALPAAPAGASHAPSTASVEPRAVFAGDDQEIRVRVSHPSAEGCDGVLGAACPAPLDLVRATLPSFLEPTDLLPPPGWAAVTDEEGRAVFRAEAGSGIEHGQSVELGIGARADRPDSDLTGDWLVEVSSDAGATVQPAQADSAGALTTVLRILRVNALDLVAPEGATDGSVTSGQTACVRLRFTNSAGTAKTVTPEISGSRAEASALRELPEDDQPPCSGIPLEDGRIGVGPGNQAGLDVNVSFGLAGDTTLLGQVRAEGAEGPSSFDAELPVTVQPQAEIGSHALVPEAVSPGSMITPRLLVSKFPGPSPAIDLSGTRIVSEACTDAELVEPTALPEGSVGNVWLEFGACHVPFIPSGRYEATLDLMIRDENGWTARSSIPAGTFRVDSSIPDAEPRVDLNVNQVEPADPGAATSGTPFRVRVEAYDRDPDTGSMVPCGATGQPLPCSLDGAFISQLGTNNQQTGSNVDLDIPLWEWVEVTVDWAPGTVRAQLSARVADGAGNASPMTLSGPFDVDILEPRVDSARTMRGPAPGQRRVIRACFSEHVRREGGLGIPALHPMDWSPMPMEIRSVNVACIDLIYGQDFPDDVQSAFLAYRPADDVNGRYMDRVGLHMPDHLVPIDDGIAPTAPVIESVNGAGPEDGRFELDRPDIEVRVGNPTGSGAVAAGYGVRLYEETGGGSGLQVSQDRLFCQGDAGDTTVTMQCLFDGFESTVYAVSEDFNGNLGDHSTWTFARS